MSFKTEKEIEDRKKAEHETIKKFQETLLRRAIWRSCLNCDVWDGTQCGKWRMIPPPHIVVNGCKDWEDDIPF